MRILFLTDNFPPELNAPATRTYEHCKIWAEKGIEVTVITCAPNFPQGKVYEGYKNKIYQRETIDGIQVIRVWTYMAENKGFIKRVLDYLSFMVSGFIAGLFVKTDLIVATSPQFFTSLAGYWLAFWKRKKWVMEVRDLWPESIYAVSAIKKNLLITFFEFLEVSMYRSAWKVITVTDAFKDRLIVKNGINPEKIEVVKNGANLELFQPQEKDLELIQKHNLNDKTIIGYIGTHGMAHKLDFILKCAKNINDPKIHFLFIGDGAEKGNLLRLKEELKLTNVTFLDPVPKKQVKSYLSILDIALVNLKKSDTFKSVIPSKIFEMSAMNKPVLLGVEGEAQQIIEKYQIGQAFEPENEADFLIKLELILNNPVSKDNFNRMLRNFDRRQLALNMLSHLEEKTID